MILVNGELTSTVSCLDRGLQFGDGLFETIAVLDGQIMHWKAHWQRLLLGCEKLYIPKPDESLFLKEINSLILDNQNCVIKLIYTRGESERGYVIKRPEPQPTRVMMKNNWPAYKQDNSTDGISLFPCNTRLSHQPALAGLKHLNRLENVLARNEWRDETYAEGLICDFQGLVVEGTMSNIFVVKNSELSTPDLSNCGVDGITRHRIIQKAKQMKINVNIEHISEKSLQKVDEIFVCNSLIGIWPVKRYANHDFNTQAGNNSITRLLQERIT